MKFLSTPSARRATKRIPYIRFDCEISIHALCEEGDVYVRPALRPFEISIHALCEEGDI